MNITHQLCVKYKKLEGSYGVIYKLTSPSGKSYVGHSVNHKSRLSVYKHLPKNLKEHQIHLYNAIKKHGFKNFKFEILCEVLNAKDFNDIEVFWINEYNLTNRKFGYNKTTGGDSGKKLTEEVKLKISKAHKGKKHTKEHCENMSKSRKGVPLNISQENREKQSKRMILWNIENKELVSKSSKENWNDKRKEEMSIRHLSTNNCNYDFTIYKIFDVRNLQQHEGTQNDLRIKFNLCRKGLNAMLKGKTRHVNGYALYNDDNLSHYNSGGFKKFFSTLKNKINNPHTD
jgi:group I intron endonuclease